MLKACVAGAGEIKADWRSRDGKGKFKRKHSEWSPSNTNDGYVDSDGRFRVYLLGHKRSYRGGYRTDRVGAEDPAVHRYCPDIQ